MGNGGDPFGQRVAASIVAEGGGRAGSDRVIVPLKPGNSGGGKDPDYWCAFEDGDVAVIGDKPRNTIKGPDPSERLLCRGAKETNLPSGGQRAGGPFSPWASRWRPIRRAGCGKSARPV